MILNKPSWFQVISGFLFTQKKTFCKIRIRFFLFKYYKISAEYFQLINIFKS
jgi:hypothetical protein